MSDTTQCAAIREEFSALLDGELTADEQAQIDEHLLECSECLRSLDTMKKVMGIYADLPHVQAPEDLLDGVHEELADNSIEFERSAKASQPVSYRPVLIAAATLAMMAGVSYIAVNGLESNVEMAAAPEAAIQADTVAIEESSKSEAELLREEAEFWQAEEAAPKKRYKPTMKELRQLHADALKNSAPPTGNAQEKAMTNDAEMKDMADMVTETEIGLTSEIIEYRKQLKEKVYNAYTIRDDGLWIEKGYSDQTVIPLTPGTDEYVTMLYNKEYLPYLTRHTRDIIFTYENKWYRIAHIGPLIADAVLGDPHPNSRKEPTDPPPQP